MAKDLFAAKLPANFVAGKMNVTGGLARTPAMLAKSRNPRVRVKLG